MRKINAWLYVTLDSVIESPEHWVIAAFGIRGIGTFYYLAYAMSHATFPNVDVVWATASFVVLVSVVLHGVAVTPMMRLLDRYNERTRTPEEKHAQ